MTGVGSARRLNDQFDISVRVRSLNSRYLDLTIRMPQLYYEFEYPLRRRCLEILGRGKVDIHVEVRDLRSDVLKASFNLRLVEAVLEAAEFLRERPDVSGEFDPSALLSLPDVLSVEPAELDDPERFRRELERAAESAIAEMAGMRASEGEKIRDDIEERLGRCEAELSGIEESADQVRTEHLDRLRKRIKELTGGVEIDALRLEQEAVLLADRSDVTEETVRLRSHFGQMRGLLDVDGIVGKKLDFLVQEMNREINTIGSKSKNIEFSHAVIEIKSELEKIREQVQNVE